MLIAPLFNTSDVLIMYAVGFLCICYDVCCGFPMYDPHERRNYELSYTIYTVCLGFKYMDSAVHMIIKSLIVFMIPMEKFPPGMLPLTIVL